MPRTLAALLFAALLLLPLAASVQAQVVQPLVVLPSDPSFKWHTVRLCYANPGDVLALMGYSNGSDAAGPLPPGVGTIFIVPSRNSLLVNANEDGFSRFTTKLFQVLDRIPQQVRLQVLVAAIPKSRKINIDDSSAGKVLDKLQEAHALFYRQKPVTALENTPITVTIDWPPVKSGSAPCLLSVTPLLTSKNRVWIRSVSVALPTTSNTPEAMTWISIESGSDMGATPGQLLGQPSGKMTFLDITSRSPTAPNKIYLFLALTILGPSPNDGSGIAIDP